jgi:hypothetical protein
MVKVTAFAAASSAIVTAASMVTSAFIEPRVPTDSTLRNRTCAAYSPAYVRATSYAVETTGSGAALPASAFEGASPSSVVVTPPSLPSP